MKLERHIQKKSSIIFGQQDCMQQKRYEGLEEFHSSVTFEETSLEKATFSLYTDQDAILLSSITIVQKDAC
jgi:hypothetical protein